jgi:acyl-CoA synthetase (NDP forming)
VEYAAWRARPEPEIVAPRVADQVRARATVNRALASAPTGRTLRDEELTELLDAYGIELWPRVPVGSADEAVAAAERLGWDVVLKATAAHLRNRPDLAHVWRNIFTPEEMRQAWESMQPMGGTGGDGAVRTGGDGPGGDGPGGEPGAQRVRTARLDADRLGADRLGAVGPGAVGPGAVGAGAETPGADERRADGARSGFVVQRNAPPGVPVAIKGVEDPLFGPVVSFGVSGAASELLGDRSYRIPPMDPLDAAEMVREIKAAPLLLGYRGSVPVDTRPVEELLLRLAQLKNDLPQVRELDLDLVVVGQEGAQVLTAAARVEPALEARSDWYVRRMAGQIGETTAG